MTMTPPFVNAVKRFFARNLTIKLLSVAVAICIWSFTAMSREIRYDLTLPVELRNIPPGFVLDGQPQREVRFTLAGPSMLIDGVRRSNSALILNLRGAVPGRTIFSHLESDLKLPEGVSVTRISPAVVEISLVRAQTGNSEGDKQQ